MAIQFEFMHERDTVKWYTLFVENPNVLNDESIKIYGAQSLTEAVTTLLRYEPKYKTRFLVGYERESYNGNIIVMAGRCILSSIQPVIEFRLIVDKYMAVKAAAVLS